MTETKAVSSETVFRGKILDVRRDGATLPDGRTATLEVVYSGDAAAVVALSSQREVFLINQYRYVTGGMLLEIPAGKMEAGEKPLECARRELEEETGYRAANWRHLATFYTSPGFCTEKIHLFMAQELTRFSQNLDRDEFIEVEKMPLDKALQMVGKGAIDDAKTIVGLLTVRHILLEGP